VPCLGNAGVGDVEKLLESRRVGVAVRDFSDAHLRDGLRRLVALVRDQSIQQRCRETAVELFSLDGGIASYDTIYRDVGAAA
jgi:glycogen synthase